MTQTVPQQQEEAQQPTIQAQIQAWSVRMRERGKAKFAWLWQRIQPTRSQPKLRQRRTARTWMDEVIDGAFLVVTSLAFLVFLVASLPHVAYFIVTFEPQNPDGTLSDWWWTVAYLIAAAINITEFLLSIKFARDLRNATRGLPWYQKFLPTLATVLKYWPFIILIAGFSWAANLEHAEQFHSSMLSTAESVQVILPFFQNKVWGDINPYIVSAYPVLNIAYTLMFDSSHSMDLQSESESEITQSLQSVSESDTGYANEPASGHAGDAARKPESNRRDLTPPGRSESCTEAASRESRRETDGCSETIRQRL